MVDLPERVELAGLAGLVVGFVVFTYGALVFAFGNGDIGTIGLVIAGGLVGFIAAGWLVVYYHVMGVVGR